MADDIDTTARRPAATGAAPAAGAVQVRLARPHTHAGEFYPAGAQIAVPASDLDWLHAHGVVEAG